MDASIAGYTESLRYAGLILPVVLLGAIVPWYLGLDFFQAEFLLGYALTPLLLMRAGITNWRELQIAALITGGVPILSIALGLTVLNWGNPGAILIPPAGFLALAGILSYATAFFAGALKSKLSRWTGNPDSARRIVLAVGGALLMLKIAGLPLLPAEWTTASALTGLTLAVIALMLAATFAMRTL